MTLAPAIDAIARSYPDEARHTPRETRERFFTRSQQLAWLLRFGSADEAEKACADIEDMSL